jgi:thymidylate synthase ThyX
MPDLLIDPETQQPLLISDDPISRYVTNTDRNVFALKNLPEEVTAVLFAYYSRSPDTLRQNLRKLIGDGDIELPNSSTYTGDTMAQAQEKARAFHEKWVVGYGHGSVAEHAVIKLAVENVSILASKLIEDVRLASYTEKSTRYVQFDSSKAFYPESVMQSSLATEYKTCIESLMQAYLSWMEPVYQHVKSHTPMTEKQTPRSYEAALRATAFDNLRYLLPTATHTNIGITINARALETMITKLLSQPLVEGQVIAREIKAEAMHVAPTLLKYAEVSEYRQTHAENPPSSPKSDVIRNSAKISGPFLDEQSALELIAAPYPVEQLNLDDLLANRGKFDPAPRCLERVNLTFEIILDYGAFRDIQRHRMATIITEPLGISCGFETPELIKECGFVDEYAKLMYQSGLVYQKLMDAGLISEAPYVLPLGYRVRTHMTANLRELVHFIELRTGRGGHPSYRKIALGVFEEIQRVYPSIAKFIRPNKGVFSLTRE